MRIAIIGAGPCGLGAAWRLNELGHDNWVLLEQTPDPGGLASSFEKDGFTWDIGGHVQFSHYEYFDKVMDSLDIEWNRIQRSAWAKIGENWVPYPVQDNIHYMSPQQQYECVAGLIDRISPTTPVSHFMAWLYREMGQGLCDNFAYPYNEKVWAHPLDQMSHSWVGERVKTPSAARALESVIFKQDQISWGPNNTFRYPKRGGTGAIWRSVAEKLKHKIVYGARVGRVSPGFVETPKYAYGKIGAEWDALISTMPITKLTNQIATTFRWEPVNLSHSSTHAVGVGIRGECPERLKDKSWMYFPDDNCPFYRVTVLSNYGDMAPKGCYSLLCEVAESMLRPAPEDVVESVITGLLNTKLICLDTRIVSTWHKRVEHGYPTPTLARDSQWAIANERLEQMGIYSRGRFGAWKYEVSNQDHSFMQGVEIVDRLLLGKEEKTLRNPDGVNGSYVRME